MASTATSAIAYYGVFVKVFALLQNCHTKLDTDDDQTTAARRSFFRNSLTSTLAQVEASPGSRAPMLAALVDFVSTAKTADGLESLFLSLLNSSNLAKDEAAFTAG